MKRLLPFALLLFSFYSKAQTTTLTGVIIDSNLVAPLEMVSVAILDPADSSLVYFGITNKSGTFKIEGVHFGNYIFQASFMGYSTIFKQISVSESGVQPPLNRVEMVMQTNVLSEIIIQGERIPIMINKDTVAYDASAFNVGADETVEDLLKRLPGIEVDPDGRVTAQGEEVKKVLVDGKEFFGGNVQLATQNLPADAIKKVKVYDRQSEDAMFTGVDDGKRDKTIDLELKEDRKKGYFGDLDMAAGGMDDPDAFRYRLKGGIHGFTPTTRLSFLGNGNNLNQMGFDFQDVQNLSGQEPGGGRGTMITYGAGSPPMNWSGPRTGVFSSMSSGFNLNFDPSKKHRLNANYFLTYTDHVLRENVDAQEFNRNVIVNADEQNSERNLRLRHQAFSEYRWEPDTNNRMEITLSASMLDDNRRHFFMSERVTDEGLNLQSGNRRLNQFRDYLDISARLNYIHKFKKFGRNIQFGSQIEEVTDLSDENYFAINDFPQSPEEQQREVIRQIRNDRQRTGFISNSVTFNEPLTKKLRMSLSVSNTIREMKHQINVEDALVNLGFIDSLSPDFTMDYMRSSAAMEMTYNPNEVHQFSGGLNAVDYRQGAIDVRMNDEIPTQNWNYFLPYFRWYKQKKGFGRTYASAERTVNLPQLHQWLVTPDFRDPLFIIEGNPNLTPELSNSVSFSHYVYNSFSQENFSYNFNASITQNPIVNAQSINESFQRVSRPVNADELQYSFSGGTNYRFPIKKLKIFIRTGVRANYAQVNLPINEEQNIQENTNVTGNLSINNFTKGKWEVTVRGSWSMNWAAYSAQPELNRYFTNQNYVGNLTYRPNKKFIIRTEMDYMLFSQETFADALAIPRWNGSVSYSWSKKGDLITKISLFDIFGRNIGLQRFANANFIRQTETNLLTRYVLFSVIYKFRKQ
ncbi:MAG: outer membrane beta-barrel protein [Cryomorphaceae bacterium]|nr:outer membrane beta-barrel protein [Cryomorphaceae bacterium]